MHLGGDLTLFRFAVTRYTTRGYSRRREQKHAATQARCVAEDVCRGGAGGAIRAREGWFPVIDENVACRKVAIHAEGGQATVLSSQGPSAAGAVLNPGIVARRRSGLMGGTASSYLQRVALRAGCPSDGRFVREVFPDDLERLESAREVSGRRGELGGRADRLAPLVSAWDRRQRSGRPCEGGGTRTAIQSSTHRPYSDPYAYNVGDRRLPKLIAATVNRVR